MIIFVKGLMLLTTVVKSRNIFFSTFQHFLASKISVDKLSPLEKTRLAYCFPWDEFMFERFEDIT